MSLLDFLDYPRQALANIGTGIGDLFEGNPEGLLSALPGAIGLLGGGLATLAGGGLPLALLAGSGAGGLAQGIGLSTGDSRFNAPTSGDIAQNLFGSDEFLPSLLAGVLTDPLTYAGGLGIGKAGSNVGANLGRKAEQEALALGPGYSNRFDDIMGQINQASKEGGGWADPVFSLQAKDLQKSGMLERALSEIPEGSKVLGMGGEATAFRTPAGDVLRMGMIPSGSQGRPIDEAVLQTTRTVDLPAGKYKSFRIERTPFADDVGSFSQPQIDALASNMRNRGVDFFDTHAGNVGRYQGRDVVIDPQGLDTISSQISHQPVTQGTSGESSLLLRLLGGQRKLRNALDTGNQLDLQTLPSLLGGGLGAGLGTLPTISTRSSSY